MNRNKSCLGWALGISIFLTLSALANSFISEGIADPNQMKFNLVMTLSLGLGIFLAIYLPYWTLNRIRQHTVNSLSIAGRLFLISAVIFIIPFLGGNGWEVFDSPWLFVYIISFLLSGVYFAMCLYHLALSLFTGVTKKPIPDTTSPNHVALYAIITFAVIIFSSNIVRVFYDLGPLLVLIFVIWLIWYIWHSKPRTLALGIIFIMLGIFIPWYHGYLLQTAYGNMNQGQADFLYLLETPADLCFIILIPVGIIYLVKYIIKRR